MAPEDETPDVMSSLPRTRPQRRSARRDSTKRAGAAEASATAAPAAAKRSASAGKKPATAKKKPTTAKKKPTTAKKKPTTAKRKPTTAKRKPATAKRPATAKKRAPTKPKPAAPRIPPAGFAPPRETEGRPVPSGVELVGTAIQAAGELAQIGAAIGGQALKSALGKLGRS